MKVLISFMIIVFSSLSFAKEGGIFQQVQQLIEPTTASGFAVNCAALATNLLNEGKGQKYSKRVEYFVKVLEKTEYTKESVALAVLARGMYFVGMISYADQIENQEIELEKAFLQGCEPLYKENDK